MSHDTSKTNKDFISFTLANWAANLTYEKLSPEAIKAAKLFLYDSLGCALGGSTQHDVKITFDHFREMGGAPTCTVFGSGDKCDPVTAAFLNALAIRAMDYNDIYWKADPSHPSDIISAPLAICEMNGLSGKELLVGIVIAYEIEMRLAEFGDPGVREYGWHHATLTSIAAPIAAGAVLGLSADVLQQAIGISASGHMCLGAVTAGKLTNMKNMVDPNATRMGVEAALLAARGCTGPEHVIDGKEGFVHCFEKFGGKFNLEMLTDNLPKCGGCHYKILDCGMKSFPIEALSHAPLSAMMNIVSDHDINPDQITEIKVEVIARAADILGDPAKYRPTSKETADHSLPYSLAVGLVDGMVTPLQFTQTRIDDTSLHGVMDKIQVVPNDEFEALFPEFQPSQVTIKLADGTTHQARVDVPKGDPRDPMTEEEIAVKFNALGESVVGLDACVALRELVMNLENETSMANLFTLMTATTTAAY